MTRPRTPPMLCRPRPQHLRPHLSIDTDTPVKETTPTMTGNQEATAPAELRDLPAFVEGVLRDWRAPGLAVAVAKDGDLVLLEGFGLRDVERGLPVTPHTVFAIGSCTKAFTTMALALLADEGKLDWDTPVKAYLPTFGMKDPFADARITPREIGRAHV